MHWLNEIRWLRWMAALILVSALAGCGRNQVKVYQLASDNNSNSSSSPSPNATAAASGQNGNNTAQPQLQWTLPKGWTQVAPGEMSVASFKVQGANGAKADVSVVPLPGSAGGLTANVNRWRGQVGLGSATPDELQKMAEAVQAGGKPAKLYDLAGQGANAKRILGVIQERNGMTWFFKMMGNASLVEQQKPEFIAFLKSLTFTAGSPSAQLPPGHPAIGGQDMSAAFTPAGADSVAKPSWTVPAGWHAKTPGQFVAAEYSISGTNGGTAMVDVAELAGSGGGLLANVNRWRGQVGLAPVNESDLAHLTRSVSLAGGQATFVDMTGTDSSGHPARLVAAMVPQGGQTWFYKLLGDAAVVTAQKDAFTQFVLTAKYPHATP